MRRVSRDPRAAAASSSLRAGARGGRGELAVVAGARRGSGWVGWTHPAATLGLRRPEPLALRAPTYERTGPQWAPAGSGPEPLSPARGPLCRGPAYARGRAAAAGAGDVALRGAVAGPTCHPLPFPRLFGAPTRERGPVQRLLLFSLPLPSSLHCPPAWWSRPRRPPPRPLSARSFADVELSVSFLLRVPFSLVERRKKVAVMKT